MSMIQHAVTAIGGVAAYGVISICLFFIVFTGSLVWALAQKKNTMQEMSVLPLSDKETILPRKGSTNHEQ